MAFEAPKASNDNVEVDPRYRRQLEELRELVDMGTRLLERNGAVFMSDDIDQDKASNLFNRLSEACIEGDTCRTESYAKPNDYNIREKVVATSTRLKEVMTEIGETYPRVFE